MTAPLQGFTPEEMELLGFNNEVISMASPQPAPTPVQPQAAPPAIPDYSAEQAAMAERVNRHAAENEQFQGFLNDLENKVSPNPRQDPNALLAQASQRQAQQQPQQPQAGGGSGVGGLMAESRKLTRDSRARAEEQSKTIGDIYDRRAETLDAQAELGAQKAAEISGFERQRNAELERDAAVYQQRQQEVQSNIQSRLGQVDEMRKQLREKKVDPNRLFKTADGERDWGTTTVAALAIALGEIGRAISGGGSNAALQIVNDTINRDIMAQQEERQAAKEDVAGEMDAIQMFRQQGMDEQQAFHATRALKLESFQMKLDELAGEYAGEEQKLQMQELKQALELEKQKEEAALAARTEEVTRADQAFRLQATGVGAQIAATQARAGMSGAKQLPAGEAKALGEIEGAQKILGKFKGTYEQKASSYISGLAQYAPWNTDAKEYNDERRVAAQVVGSILEGGKLTEDDFARYYEMLPAPGDSDDRARNKLAVVQALLQAMQDASKQALAQSGYAVPAGSQVTAKRGLVD